MYNNLEDIMQRRKILNIKILLTSSIFLVYFYYYLFRDSIIMLLYTSFVLFIIILMFRSIIKVKPEKLKEEFFKDEEFESTSCIEYPLIVFLSTSASLTYIFLSGFMSIFEKIGNLKNIESIIYLLLVCTLIYAFYYFIRRYNELHTMIYYSGIRIYSGDILFTDIKKYNFLKLKKSGYSFEINLGGEYHRFKVSEEQKLRISELISIHKEKDNKEI